MNTGGDPFCSDIDAFMADNDDFLVLVAAGNSGRDGPLSVGSPATAKNCVAVGATDNVPATSGGSSPDSIAVFSSLGPTDGGRIKPDVTAPGAPVASASSDSGCEYVELQVLHFTIANGY